MSPLSQFDVICIIPLWLGNNEFSITNLSFTVLFVIIIGIVSLYWLYSNQVIPRSWQVMLKSIFMSIYRIVYFFFFKFKKKKIIFTQKAFYVRSNVLCSDKIAKIVKLGKQRHEVYRTKHVKKSAKLYEIDSVQDHPFIPKAIKTNRGFIVMFFNLTTSDRDSSPLAKVSVLHNTKAVHIYNRKVMVLIKDKKDLTFVKIHLKERSRLDLVLTEKMQKNDVNQIFTDHVEAAVNNISPESKVFEGDKRMMDVLDSIEKKID